jgi:hypothetical protein
VLVRPERRVDAVRGGLSQTLIRGPHLWLTAGTGFVAGRRSSAISTPSNPAERNSARWSFRLKRDEPSRFITVPSRGCGTDPDYRDPDETQQGRKSRHFDNVNLAKSR